MGYYHSGGDLCRTCTSSGDWTGITPTCTLVTCKPDFVPNSSKSSNQNRYDYNTAVKYSCDMGYYHSGGDLCRTCTSSGYWTGNTPICTTSTIECTADDVQNSWKWPNLSAYEVGVSVDCYCNTGYYLSSGDQTRTCSSSGYWNGSRPTCSIVTCTPVSVPNSSKSPNQTSYDYNTAVTYYCDAGYYHSGGDLCRTCTSSGYWTGSTPTCTYGEKRIKRKSRWMGGQEAPAIECTADYVQHSWKWPDWSAYDVDVSVDYYCNTGYYISRGDQTRTCTSPGYWTGSSPTCSIVTCTPDAAPNSSKSPNLATYDYNTAVTYSCDTGYNHTGGDLTRTCTSSGYSTGTAPTCTVVTCTPDAVAHSGKTPDQAKYDYNTAVVYSCNAGYDHMSGDLSRTCKANTTWTGTTPACTRSLEPVCFPNGTVIVNNPDAADLISAHASNTDHMCNIKWIASADNTQQKEALEITGCDLSSAVLVAFSTRVEEEEIQGGSGVLSYVIQCNQTDDTGVAREFTQSLEHSLSTNTVPSVSPTFTIVSNFRYTSATGPIQTAATVGDQLYWTVDIPEKYTVLPITCTAYAGTSAPGSVLESLIDQGCTLDNYIVQSFSDAKIDTSIPRIKRYYTTLRAFNFYTSDLVFFQCSLKSCPESSTDCDINCTRRKNRSAHLTDAEVTYGTTSRVLRVGKAADSSSSATKIKSKTPGMIVVYMALAWLPKLLLQ